MRYRTDETDDGMSGKEGSFLICSFYPALTAMANGLRVGDHLLERLGAKPTAREAAGAI